MARTVRPSASTRPKKSRMTTTSDFVASSARERPVTVLPRNTQSGFATLNAVQCAPLSRQMRHCW